VDRRGAGAPASTGAGSADDAWSFLLGVRDAVNAAIEPLRASKTLATTLEAEVVITAPEAVIARLSRFGDELIGFLLVARAELVEAAGAHEMAVEVRKTSLPKCERCWTHRPDVGPDGLCSRCVRAVAARGVSPGAPAPPGAGSGA
jgi:isoleucyl-tRNA synthetase